MSFKLHRSPPFRAEHVGSLLRPKELLDTRKAVENKEASADELKSAEDKAVKDIVEKQTQWGYPALTDGEYRRSMFWGLFWPNLEGMEEIPFPPLELFRPYMPDISAFIENEMRPGESVLCTGKIRHPGKSAQVPEYEYLKSVVPKEKWGEIKVTMPAPEWYHMRYVAGKAYPKEVYSNDQDYFADIAKAYNAELDILYKAGVRNIQFDDPNFAYFCAEPLIQGWVKDPANKGIDLEDMLDSYIKLYNDCIATAPADMHMGLHICRGNFVGSRHFSEGGYDRIAVKLFQHLNFHTFYLEYDTPRAGGFEPLAHLPKNKNAILGVVTSKFPEMEDKEKMKERVYQAAETIAKGNNESKEDALNRLGVSPQCGFASHAGGNLVTQDDMAKKLHLVREIANEIWPGQS